MATKKFPSELSNRGTVKPTDKLLIHNIDTGATNYTTVSGLFTNPSFNDKITVNGEGIIGDINANYSEISATPVINKFMTVTTDASINYILLSYNSASGTFSTTGFDGQIKLYRGNSSAWNAATEYDVTVKNAYNNYPVTKFNVCGSLTSTRLVTLLYGTKTYVALEIPSTSGMDIYYTGRYWGFEPTKIAASSASGVTFLSYPRIAQNTTGSVAFGMNTFTSKFNASGLPVYNDNTNALASGLTAGAFYRTGDTLKIVH